MPALIIVRIVPAIPTGGTSFTNSLTNLTLKAYDRTVNNTSPDIIAGTNDSPLGTATGLVPFGTDLIIIPQSGTTPPSYKASIVQHFEIVSQGNAAIKVSKAVATALIVADLDLSTRSEYPSSTAFDVRLEASRNNVPISLPVNVEYNITALSTTTIQSLDNTAQWPQSLFPSTYLFLPAPLPSDSIAAVTLGNAASPPNFYILAAAIDKVLKLDHPAAIPTLETAVAKSTLSISQCQEIAEEIEYERTTDPAPAPPYSIESMYTTPDNQTKANSDTKETFVG